MFVYASALVAILLGEEDAMALSSEIEAADEPFTSPIAVFETVLAVNHVRAAGVVRAHSAVLRFLHRARIAIVPIGNEAATLALDAFARYGKGQGHSAQFDLGDCFAYALAKAHGARLLHKGDDFSRTDLA